MKYNLCEVFTMAKSRLVGDYPVIGIRPTIDGRRGPLKVRESLEDQTMNMAKRAAKLFTDNLKYSSLKDLSFKIKKGKGCVHFSARIPKPRYT